MAEDPTDSAHRVALENAIVTQLCSASRLPTIPVDLVAPSVIAAPAVVAPSAMQAAAAPVAQAAPVTSTPSQGQ